MTETPTVREIAELTARLRDISARGRDVDPAEREQFLADKDALIARIADRNESVEDAADDAAAWPPMPEWMREQARRTETEIAAGTYVPGPVDDPTRLAARLAEFRAARGEVDDDVTDEIATANPHIWDEPSPPTGGRNRDPLSCLEPRGPGRVDEQERREQLSRWHTDDQAANAQTDDQADAPDDARTRFTCGSFHDQQGGTP